MITRYRALLLPLSSLLCLAILFSLFTEPATTQTTIHPNQIRAGTFSSGAFTFPGSLIVTGTQICKTFQTIACVDSANTAGWAGATADLWIQAAINSATNGQVFIAAGSYNIGSAAVAISMKSGVRLTCNSNQSTVLTYSGTGVAIQWGDGVNAGVLFSSLENCGLVITGAGANGLKLNGGNIGAGDVARTVIRGNQIQGSGSTGAGILMSANDYVTRIENNEITNFKTEIDMPVATNSLEATHIEGNTLGCNGIASSFGINVHPAGGGDLTMGGNDVVNCNVGIQFSNTTYTVKLNGGHMEQNQTQVNCNGNTNGGEISGIDMNGNTGGLGGAQHAVVFVGCQNWRIGPLWLTGTYAVDQLSLDTNSFGNTVIGFDPLAASTILAAGSSNVFLNSSSSAGRIDAIGGQVRSYRAGNLPTQFLALDGTGGQTRINTGAGFSTVDFSINGTNAFEYSTTALYPLTATNTFGSAANPAGGLFLTTAGSLKFNNVLLLSGTAPTIAAAGCGGAAASIVVANGTGAFKVNVGTTPTSACTLTFPSATTGWNVTCNDITTQSASVFVQKQTGAESQTSVTITNFNTSAAATAFVASDILKCTAAAD